MFFSDTNSIVISRVLEFAVVSINTLSVDSPLSVTKPSILLPLPHICCICFCFYSMKEENDEVGIVFMHVVCCEPLLYKYFTSGLFYKFFLDLCGYQ